MYQGLQGLQTWAWTKSKGLLRHWHLLNPQRLLKGHQDTLTHTYWHQWQFSQQSPPLSLMTTPKLPLVKILLFSQISPFDQPSFTFLVQLFLPLWHQWKRVLLVVFVLPLSWWCVVEDGLIQLGDSMTPNFYWRYSKVSFLGDNMTTKFSCVNESYQVLVFSTN